MKRNNQNMNKRYNVAKWFIVLLVATFVFACDSDEVGNNFYTFTGDTVGSYIESDPDNYSELIRLLDTTEVMGLLKGYGEYTVFIADNDAMKRFYSLKGRTALNQFPKDTLKKIVYDHIIKDHEFLSENFVDGFLPNVTMSGRFIKIGYESSDTGLKYIVNSSAEISTRDIEVHNGVIHKISEVLAPTENTIMEAIAADEKFSLFYQALVLTELENKLQLVEDESYVADPVLVEKHAGTVANSGLGIVPMERKYGYTVLMESDETYRSLGIETIEDLKAKAKEIYDVIYPEHAHIDDVTSRYNSFNRYIAYHLLERKVPSIYFIERFDNTGSTDGTSHSVKTYEMYEYLETMCPNTLMEVRTLRSTGEYNLFNMIESTGEVVRLTDDFDNDAINGVYHEIDGILAYKQDFVSELTTKRIRIDAAAFFPEFANNSIRVGNATFEYGHLNYNFPDGYVERVNKSETTELHYLTSDDRFKNYQGDEIFLAGVYDFEITTPAIPKGTYEVRFGYQVTIHRGSAQLYWDGQPAGIPLRLDLYGSDTSIGYEEPGSDEDDPEGYENDKAMRNRGYMKGGASYKVINDVWNYIGSGRTSNNGNGNNLRKILGIYTFTEDTTHVLGVRAASYGEFMFDYLEFVPLEAIAQEGID